MIIKIIALVIISLCFFFLFQSRRIWTLNQARRKGLYPPAGKATMFDVRRLILQGEKEVAVQVYSEIFQTGSKEARRAVDELEKNIQQKDSGID